MTKTKWLRFRSWAAIALMAGGLALLTARPAVSDDESSYASMSLEDLLNIDVVSASNTIERLTDAPATVIVLTREELWERGITELSQIFDDLPGMQPVRPYGVTYFKNYWRGYRNAIGEPFLVMVDGIIMNHLYYNSATVLSAIPISNVDRVEVVYGPASAVYGANAFMGVINVITAKENKSNGNRLHGLLGGGSADARLIDANEVYQMGDFRISVTGRIDNGLDDVQHESYEYTKNRYYTERGLWGGFLDNPNLAGPYGSERQNRSLDLRANWGTLEAGLQYYDLKTGYGTEYAADKESSRALWDRPELGIFLRSKKDLGNGLKSTTLIRYRKSDVANDSQEVTSYESTDADGNPVQIGLFSYWQSLNSSWSLYQDFDLKVSDALSFTAGLKYEQKDLQKAYDVAYGPEVPSSQLDGSSYPYPDPPTTSFVSQNRITTEDYGGYILGKYHFGQNNALHLGIRADHNNRYGTATTVRAGYVGTFGVWGLKALYGEAFQEPTPRLLYGGWTGSGSDPNLDPETSRTVEISGSYTSGSIGALLDVYDVHSADTIVSVPGGAKNLGDRDVIGADLHFQTFIKVPAMKRLRIWAYYTHIFQEKEKRFAKNGSTLPDGAIGDLAKNTINAGVTGNFNDDFNATLRARWVGERDTVASNPIDKVSSWATVDAVVNYENILGTHLGLQLKVTNLFDKTYFEPGVRSANAGDVPGYFDESGLWHGSAGWNNSLLPQPGRQALLSLHLDI